MTLNPFFVEKAKVELQETDARKKQSLELFRNWISRHPFLRNVRQDDILLLRFLRLTKYNMNKAMKTYEQFYLAPKNYPRLIPDPDMELDNVLELLRTGYCYPLPDRDSDGCRILIVQSKRLNPDKHTLCDGTKFGLTLMLILLEEEETQIGGFKFIFDQRDITMKHLFMPKDAIDYADMVKNTSIGRLKGVYLVNLPTIAHFMVDLIRRALSKKLKERIHLFRTWNELENSKIIDNRILPKELGGIKPEAEMIKEFEIFVIQRLDIIRNMIQTYTIDYTKLPKDKIRSNWQDESVNSFRKLEID